MSERAGITSLPAELLRDIFLYTPSLAALQSIILSHPVLYYAFQGRRTLVVQTVFRNQVFGYLEKSHDEAAAFKRAEVSIVKQRANKSSEAIILRAALWPYMSRRLPSKRSLRWGRALVISYTGAGMKDAALALAENMWQILAHGESKLRNREERDCARILIHVYRQSAREQEAMALLESVLDRLFELTPEWNTWAKVLSFDYRAAGRLDDEIELVTRVWKLNSDNRPPTSQVTLEWARALVRAYLHSGKEEAALKFQRRVLGTLSTRSAEYAAWARQLIHMLKRAGRANDAVEVRASVWTHFTPRDACYYGWAKELCEEYRALDRADDAIAVEERVWALVSQRWKALPADSERVYHAQAASWALGRSYRRRGDVDLAVALEAQCPKPALHP